MNTRPLFFFGSRSTVRSSGSTRTRTRHGPRIQLLLILRCAPLRAAGVAVTASQGTSCGGARNREMRCNKPCECLRSQWRGTLEVVIRIARSNAKCEQLFAQLLPYNSAAATSMPPRAVIEEF